MGAPSDDELNQLRERVAASPSDLRLRFAFGELLFRRQDYAPAILELQQAMADPKLRRSAGELIAQAFDARRMDEAAARMRRLVSGDDPESDGSAPVPVPVVPRPPTRHASGAKDIPHDEQNT